MCLKTNRASLRLDVKGTKDLTTKDVREKLLQALVDSALESDLARAVKRGNEDLPRRWLPHGSYSDLYTLYCAHQAASGEKVASSTTFYRVLSESGWKKKIKFSPPSAHSKCSICVNLKARIQHAKGIAEQTDASDKLLRHLAGQFSDRAVYHECRSRAKTVGDIICLITDSMDRSKYSLPRYHRGRAPKDVATVDRPSLEVTTTLVHGVGVFTYLADENQSSGTNWVLETLTRLLLSKVGPLFTSKGLMFKVMLDIYALPEVAERVSKNFNGSAPQVLQTVPVSTRKGIYVHPWMLDMSDSAKYGQGGKWPSNVAIRTHFPSVVQRGYETEREPLEIKFPEQLFGTGQEVPMFAIQFVDGHAKAVMVLSVFALLHRIETCWKFG
eukprot:s1440_g7.t1